MTTLALGELERVAKAARLLESRAKHLVATNVRVRDGAARKAHGFLKVFTVVSRIAHCNLHRDGRNFILVVVLIHQVDVLASSLGLFLARPVLAHVGLDTGTDGQLGGTLTNLGKIGTRKAGSALGEEVEVDTFRERGFAQSGLENGQTRRFVGKGNVNELLSVSFACYASPDRDDRDGEEQSQSGPVDS